MIVRKRQGYIIIYELQSIAPTTIPDYVQMVKEDYARFGATMSSIVDVRLVANYGLLPILLQELRQAMPELTQMDISPVSLVGANHKTPVGRMATALEFVEDNPRYRFFDDVETAVVWTNQWYIDNDIDRDVLFKDQISKTPALANKNATDEDILNDMFADVIETNTYLRQKIIHLENENKQLDGLEQCTGNLKLEGNLLRVQHSRAKNAPTCPIHGRSRPVVRGEEVPRIRQAQSRYTRIAANNDMIAIYKNEHRRLRDMIIDLWAGSWEIKNFSKSN